ncbi:Ribonuclease/ribotoxin [Armillaria fumosa]|nr:Ribonuclease/ribotoxin [Armillaria fumosa]
MKFATQSIVLAALFFTSVFGTPMKGRSAAPSVELSSASPLLARTTTDGKPISCGPKAVYYPSVIKQAIDHGHKHIGTRLEWVTKSKTTYYPHEFGNHEDLDIGSCPKKPYDNYLFPILTGGIYNGGNPYADRVVFDSRGNYCAVITHTGAERNGGFVSCTTP